MKTRFIYLLPLIAAALIAIILVVGLDFTQKKQKFKSLISQPLPIINAQSILNNKPLRLNISDEKYILHVFSSWCQHCLLEHRKLVRLKNNNSIPIYGLAIRDDAVTIRKMLEFEGNPFKDVAIDNNGRDSIELGVRGIPDTLIIENDRIIDRFLGGVDEKTLLAYFAR